MTTDPDNKPESPQSGAQSAPAGDTPPQKPRFNPFANEEDMFKIVLWAGAAVLLIIVLVVLARVAF